jgi:FtsP/CotA-like multicopper oxidase with cupredoxin domain
MSDRLPLEGFRVKRWCEIKQKASLCWYRSHLMGRTGEQVLRGLAGLFLIEDEESRSLRLPSEYGVDDIPLIIQDRRFNRDGSFSYLSAMHDVMMGYKGDAILVNGTIDPHLVLRRRRTRLRVLNASNSRIYTLGRDDGMDLLIIGSDGSLLERPVRQRRVRVGPGERIELLVDARVKENFRLISYRDRIAGRGMGPGMMMGGMADNSETFAIIELRAGKLEASDVPPPERLIDVPKWTEAQAVRSRTFTLDMGMMGMGMGGMGRMMGRPGMGGMMGINGAPWTWRASTCACRWEASRSGRSRMRRRWPIPSTSTSSSVCSTATVNRRCRMRTGSRIRSLSIPDRRCV